MHADPLTIIVLGFLAVSLITFVDMHFRGRLVKPSWHAGSDSIANGHRRRPRETVLIVPSRGNNIWMPALSTDNKPAMSINGHWYVRNMTPAPVRFSRAFIMRPRVEGDSVLVRPPESISFGDHSIDPGSISEVLTRFWIQPAVSDPDSDFSATVVLVDQLGNEHAVENVRFRCWPG